MGPDIMPSAAGETVLAGMGNSFGNRLKGVICFPRAYPLSVPVQHAGRP